MRSHRATDGHARRGARPSHSGPALAGCALAALLAGCGGSTGSTASATPTVPPTTSTASPASTPNPSASRPHDTVVEISVVGRTVSPPPARTSLAVGDRVHLVVTVDKANILHVHGVDIERDVKAGVPAIVDFTVDQPGVYPIELHEPELLLTQLVVR